jgi:ribosomal-protein-alanine N-acetyltransferase
MLNDDKTTIRLADIGDIDQIYGLERAYSQNPWSCDGIAGALSDPHSLFFVLQLSDNEIIGFVCSSIVIDELQILEVVIHPDYRNRGLGLSLINHLLSIVVDPNFDKRVTRTMLEVRISNHRAIKLYENAGFKKDAVRKGYYQNGEDAVLMSKEIILG